MKKFLSLLLSAVMLVSITAGLDFSSYASTYYESENNNTFSSANSFSIGNTISGSANNNDIDFFKFTLSKGGRVVFNISAYTINEAARITLYNSNFAEDKDGWNNIAFYDSNFGYARESYEFMLQPGTYYLKFQVGGTNASSYNIGTSFTASNQTYSEPDAYFPEAHNIALGKTIRGQVDTCFSDTPRNNYDRDYDVYKFSLSEKTNIKVNYTMKRNAYNHNVFTVQLFDPDVNELGKVTGQEASSSGNITKTLNKGTYYIAVTGDPRDMITYSLNVSFNVSKPSNFNVSSRGTTSLKLTWKKASSVNGYQLQQYKGGKWTTVSTTTSNSCTAKKLNSGTSYKFRVRSYKSFNGAKYYSGWVNLTTPTKPATITFSSLKSAKFGFTAKWKKTTCTGYQIQYATNSKFTKNKKTVTVSKNSTTSKKVTKLKTKTKYYVRVRAYKTVNGTKYYGSWSKTKTVKTK